MAKRKRRKSRSTARRHSGTTHRRRSTRRRYHRNPGISTRGIVGRTMSLVKDGVIGGVTVVGGEAATRLIRSRVLGMPAGQTLSTAAEAGIAVAGGLIAEKMFGRQVGRDFVVGGFAGIFRATAKQLGVPLVSEALADEARVILPRNRRMLSGYPSRALLSGYPTPGDVLGDEVSEELGY